MENSAYTIHWTEEKPVFEEGWHHDVWQKAETLSVSHFHPRSSAHRPTTEVKLLYDDVKLYVFFRVQDRYVKSSYTEYQGPVYRDSCVEFFVRPCVFRYRPDMSQAAPCYQGYFNIEINCVGTMLIYYIQDWTRTSDGFAEYIPVPEECTEQMTVYHTLSGRIDQEIEHPVEWLLGYTLPFSLLEHFLGALDIRQGRPWQGNFFKCADHSSHPHWGSWRPLAEELNFHQPQFFGALEFGE